MSEASDLARDLKRTWDWSDPQNKHLKNQAERLIELGWTKVKDS